MRGCARIITDMNIFTHYKSMQLFLSLFQLISNITPIMNIFVTLKTNKKII